MSNNIEGKVVVITGVNSGLGEATARLRSAQGTSVVLGARRAKSSAAGCHSSISVHCCPLWPWQLFSSYAPCPASTERLPASLYQFRPLHPHHKHLPIHSALAFPPNGEIFSELQNDVCATRGLRTRRASGQGAARGKHGELRRRARQ